MSHKKDARLTWVGLYCLPMSHKKDTRLIWVDLYCLPMSYKKDARLIWANINLTITRGRIIRFQFEWYMQIRNTVNSDIFAKV